MKNKKIKEINLTPDYSPASFPNHRRNSLSTGQPNMSADQNHSRTVMQRVNKNVDLENEEELDEFVEDVALIKEFLDSTAMDRFLGGAKSVAMSVPVFGDAFALGKFMFTIAKLRRANRKFTRKLGSLTNVDLGNDFLEPEGTLSSENVLDNNLAEAVHRISNLDKFPELNVTTQDIKNLDSKFALMCKYVKDAIMEFIGFADVAFGQKGFFLNMGINFVTFSELPDYLTGEYAEMIERMDLEASAKEGENYSGLLNFFRKALSALTYGPRKIGDLLGSLDLLINIQKLRRLSIVHKALEVYRDVDTSEEYFEKGLDALPGTQYYYYLKDLKDASTDVLNTQQPQLTETNSYDYLQKFLLENKHIVSDNPSLSELYEDEDEESVEEHFVGGVVTKMGSKSDGSPETSKERKKRIKAADIYRRHLQEVQSWKHMTSGRRK